MNSSVKLGSRCDTKDVEQSSETDIENVLKHDAANIHLEVGTYTGYASHFLVEGLKPGGEFHAVEINRELKPLLKNIGPNMKIESNAFIGPATEVIDRFSDHGIWSS